MGGVKRKQFDVRSRKLSPPSSHWLMLLAVFGLGTALRFWNLDSKPLWLDEVITALFTLGHSLNDVPRDAFFPLSDLSTLFRFQPGLSLENIAQSVAIESTHPPLFFCLMYGWLSWLQPGENWVWALRSLPALFGVGTIAAMYWLNRTAFSRREGLVSAALVAVSPLAVYLSQEARHYTLPMLLITLALVGLVQVQQDLNGTKHFRPIVWLGWVAVNLLGLYTHYFFLLALVGEIVALTGWQLWQNWQQRRTQLDHWGAIALALGGIALGYLPWLPTMLNHLSRPETDWLRVTDPDWLDRVRPFIQTGISWILMVIALPVEHQPWRIAIPLIVIAVVFTLWLMLQVGLRAPVLWKTSIDRAPIILLTGFTLCVVLEFFAVVYVLNKDITVAPRYTFVYYPGLCALLGACLAQAPLRIPRVTSKQAIAYLLAVGVISSSFAVWNLAFHKPFQPDQVAADMAFEPDKPLVIVSGYRSLQEVALGLSYALAIRDVIRETGTDIPVQIGFLERSSGFRRVWSNLSQMDSPVAPPLNLWAVGERGMKLENFPPQLRLTRAADNTKIQCPIDPTEFHKRGFPYLLFRCRP